MKNGVKSVKSPILGGENGVRLAEMGVCNSGHYRRYDMVSDAIYDKKEGKSSYLVTLYR